VRDGMAWTSVVLRTLGRIGRMPTSGSSVEPVTVTQILFCSQPEELIAGTLVRSDGPGAQVTEMRSHDAVCRASDGPGFMVQAMHD
jgi:hypothetical protein